MVLAELELKIGTQTGAVVLIRARKNGLESCHY